MQKVNGFRLSPQQKYLWLFQQDSPAYRLQGAILIEGNIQIDSLTKALEKVSDRHEILRTTFQRRPGLKLPIQVVSHRSSVSWNWLNFSDARHQEQEAKLEDIFLQEKSASFNLEQNPVWRLSLIALSSDRHILLVSLPALCADTQTLKNLVRELSQCYATCLRGEELSDEVVQYVQFSEWQNELLEDEEAADGKEYWTGQDFSALASLRLPFEKKTSGVPAQFYPQSFEVKLELALLDKLEAIALQYNTSLSAFLLACWKILLWRLTGKSNITVGVAFDGRKYEELEPALGLFAKFLPLCSHLAENLSFAEVLKQVQECDREAYKWQEYFCREYLGDSSGYPFGFEFEEQLEKYSAAGISFSLYKQYAYCDRFKVKLSCQRRNDAIAAEFDFDPAFLGEEAVRCLAEQFHALVQSAASNPETAIGDLEMLSDRARHQLLVEFNSTKAYYQLDKCVHHLFEEQAERSPEKIAAVCENQQITYGELNARADKIAYYLQQLGVKPEAIVGICVERSLEAIAGILGILKAGGAYLPLDPAMPKERLALMLQNTQTPVLLTQQNLLERLPETQIKIICLDAAIPSCSSSLRLSPSPENLAYVIYTSGSTGTPKGVAIEHRQLLNYLHGIQERLNLPSGANFATVSTFAADLGHTVIFPALCSGGCLHIISQERATDPEAIATYFQQHSIDCLKIVPSHLTALLSASNPAQILPKKRLILGGEPLNWHLIETIQKYNPDCSIFNHYGPTETTVGVLTYQVKAQGDRISETVPLGRPLPNTQIYLLDSYLQPVPLGVPGELYIGGAGLARGYLQQPELTAEKFIRHPFSQEAEALLYKTGDLARYLPDGNIEFIGRIDRQVKLRGFRVELGEIEAVLSGHPSVSEAVVLFQENQPGNQRLVGYIVDRSKLGSQDSELIESLRSFLKEKLPEYMIPSAFVVLKALPLTPNGKIDRQALPAPELAASLTDTFVDPRTPLEETLAGIWSELLSLKKVGIHDNFFDLGGHSLLITQLLARVREYFQVELPLRVLFEAPTVAGLAEKIEMKQGGNTSGDRPSNFDLNAEAVLDPAICAKTLFTWSTTEPSAIFLTGATGFLGTFLLEELLQKTQADIYCLVRADNADSAKKKIQNSLESYELWQESFSSRIIPIVGELSKPLFGLSSEQFQALANQIDIIYHNGALVNFVYAYSALKPANVLGTQEILRLASQSKIKPVHFVSTINAVSPAKGDGVKIVRENDCINPDEVMESGYVESKWVAEKLINIAGERGIPVSIYRPGRIVWHSQTGVGNTSDKTFRMLKGCIQMGSVPETDESVNLIPVDFISKAIVHLSRQKDSLGKAFHLINPNPAPFKEVVNWVRFFGYPLREISDEQWREELRTIVGKSPDNPLYPLVPFWSKSSEKNTTSPVLQFDCQNTLDSLATTNINCPPVSPELLTKFLSYLIKKGVLSSPNSY